MRSLKLFSLLLTLFTVLFLNTSFSYKLKQHIPKYHVALGKVDIGGKTEIVVSNVVYVNCKKYHSDIGVGIQFKEFYDAYFKKSRGSSSLGEVMSSGYDTYDKAEKRRRELISLWSDRNPILITNFSFLCEND
jgi:hypothetical protein